MGQLRNQSLDNFFCQFQFTKSHQACPTSSWSSCLPLPATAQAHGDVTPAQQTACRVCFLGESQAVALPVGPQTPETPTPKQAWAGSSWPTPLSGNSPSSEMHLPGRFGSWLGFPVIPHVLFEAFSIGEASVVNVTCLCPLLLEAQGPCCGETPQELEYPSAGWS